MGEDAKDNEALEREFLEIIKAMDAECHGAPCWKRAQAFLSNRFEKSRHRLSFLGPKMAKPPIQWEDVREHVWPGDTRRQDNNRFHLLQGDIITTSLVDSMMSQDREQIRVFGNAMTDHREWMVLSADCDAVRAAFVRVAPVFSQEALIDNLALAVTLRKPSLFPLPRLQGDLESIVGRYADLASLFLLDCRDGRAALPTRVASLTTTGWHMLNAQIAHHATRSDEKEEALKLRNYCPPSERP